MTAKKDVNSSETCPVQGLLKMLAGRFKPEVFRLALDGPLRFSTLLKQIDGANKQTLSVALRELEEMGLLHKSIIQQKPLHIEYTLSEKGKSLVPIFEQLENFDM